MKFKYTKSNKPLNYDKKRTFNFFMKVVWVTSNTNLHFVDFKNMFKSEMKRMYNPVKIYK